MTILIDDQTVRDSFDWRLTIEALRVAYSGDVAHGRWPRRSMARGERSWLRTLSGVSADSGLMGAKLIAVSTERRRQNRRRGRADHGPRPRRALHPASPLGLRRR
ncbi:hypothetical protein Q5425_03280 [Amycolatopsis sp. A133]|uniref:hypothetical protein n=1 Tax=Amycolatopsis sp. A133 TaxID=3064472 RepID=UPI0027FA91FF|nr:hypothetical protein [Amycolatopsis sp. A133]MDQ7802737.1 hypothetical protein [Amycolatopsis sp. A133]